MVLIHGMGLVTLQLIKNYWLRSNLEPIWDKTKYVLSLSITIFLATLEKKRFVVGKQYFNLSNCSTKPKTKLQFLTGYVWSFLGR